MRLLRRFWLAIKTSQLGIAKPLLIAAILFVLGLMGWLITHGQDRLMDSLSAWCGLGVLFAGICWVAIKRDDEPPPKKTTPTDDRQSGPPSRKIILNQ